MILERSTPAAEGVPSDALLAWMRRIDGYKYVHSFILMRHGKVIAEAWRAPYRPDLRHRLYSTSKSFVSCAIGIAAGEGLLSLSDKLVDFFPESLPPADKIDPRMKLVTLSHLLSMNSGHANCQIETAMDIPGAGDDWIKSYLATRLPYLPGTHFAYNSGNTYMLSAVIQRVSGMTLRDYLKPRLFEPLGIKNVFWETCPRGVTLGGWGLELTTEELAAFTQMILQKGEWHGKRLVPASYVKDATSYHSDNSTNAAGTPDWRMGYGYQFWVCQHNCFRGDGWGGQYAFVDPENDFVMAVNSGLMVCMQSVLDAYYEEIRPRLSAKPVEEDGDSAKAAFRDFAGSFKMPLAEGGLYKRIPDSSYSIEKEEFGFTRASFKFGSDFVELGLEGRNGLEKLRAGFGRNIESDFQLIDFKPTKVSSSAAWRSENTLVIFTVWTETPFITEFVCTFGADGKTVTIEDHSPIRFRQKYGPVLRGTLEKERTAL